MGIFIDIENEAKALLDRHRTAIDDAEKAVAAMAGNPLAQAAMAAVFGPGVTSILAKAVTDISAEFERMIGEATANGHAAGVASVAPAEPAPEPALEGEQPAG